MVGDGGEKMAAESGCVASDIRRCTRARDKISRNVSDFDVHSFFFIRIYFIRISRLKFAKF